VLGEQAGPATAGIDIVAKSETAHAIIVLVMTVSFDGLVRFAD